jgi:hypothetical protein
MVRDIFNTTYGTMHGPRNDLDEVNRDVDEDVRTSFLSYVY